MTTPEQARENRSLGAMVGEGWGVRITEGPTMDVMRSNFFEMPFLPSIGHTITFNRSLYRVAAVHIDYDENEIHIQTEKVERQSRE